MQYGMFLQSSHPPGKPLGESIEQDLEVIEWCDQLGYEEAWVGEHLTAAWEPVPACDLVLARAMERTEHIKLCAGAYVLPLYHPAELAMRIAQMDHMLQDRFICGIAAGGTPTDMPLIDVDPQSGRNRDMMRESLEIMVKLWTEHVGPEFTYEGEFWTVNNPGNMWAVGPHIKSWHQPHPPLAMAGLSPNSDTIRYAGEHGYIPLSLTFNSLYLRSHWQSMEEGAEAGGRTADREDWRVVRDVVVAETDEEAKEWVRDSLMADHWNVMNFPMLRAFNWVQYLKPDPDHPDEDVDVDYLIDHLWMVGSVETVTRRLVECYEELGGFGTLIVNKYDHGDTPDFYRRSLELLVKEVGPAFEKAIAAK